MGKLSEPQKFSKQYKIKKNLFILIFKLCPPVEGKDVTVIATTMMITRYINFGGRSRGEEDRVLPVTPDVILFTKFDLCG